MEKCRAAILAAFASTHVNLGDYAIFPAEMQFLRQFGTAALTNSDFKRCLGRIPEQTIIVSTGGGNFGDIWIHEDVSGRNFIKN